MAKENNWQPNDTQKQFMEILREYPDGVTLLEIKLERGIEFKTGSINTLTSKGLVKVSEEDKAFACDIVYNGSVVGHCTKKGKVYRLA